MSPHWSTPSHVTGHVPAPSPDLPRADTPGILRTRRPLILRIALAVIILAAAAALLLPRQYTSSTVILLEQRRSDTGNLSASPSQRPADTTMLQNQIQILMSRELASRVINQLQLYNDPEFNPVLMPPGPAGMLRMNFWLPNSGSSDVATAHDRILTAFLNHVSAEANGFSTTITVYATAQDPKKAQAIASALVQAYGDDQVSTRGAVNQGISDTLEKRTSELARQLMLDGQAVQKYKADHGLTDSAPGNSPVDQQVAAINAQIVQTRSDLAQKQAASDHVGAATGDAIDVGQMTASPLMAQLRNQQTDLIRLDDELSGRYGPLHPKLQAVQAQERDINARIAQETTRIADSLRNDVFAAKARLASLEQSLSQAERQASSQNLARVELQALQTRADATKAQYETLVGRLHQTVDEDSAAPESRLLSSAALPLEPDGPPRGLIMGASIPLGFLLGILAALIGSLSPRRANLLAQKSGPHTSAQATFRAPAEAWDGPPILAELANAEKMSAAAYVVDYPGSRYAEAMSALVDQLDSREASGSVVAVTSAQGGESKSAVAVSLARAAAQMGRKTVLVDCDPSQLASKAMNAPGETGLYDVLSGAVPLSQALAKDSRSGVYALTMTRRPPRLAAMFTSAAMAKLLRILREGADLVVLDCSRAGMLETGSLARLGDATLVVARKEMLGQPALSQSLEALADAHVAPLAIVATR